MNRPGSVKSTQLEWTETQSVDEDHIVAENEVIASTSKKNNLRVAGNKIHPIEWTESQSIDEDFEEELVNKGNSQAARYSRKGRDDGSVLTAGVSTKSRRSTRTAKSNLGDMASTKNGRRARSFSPKKDRRPATSRAAQRRGRSPQKRRLKRRPIPAHRQVSSPDQSQRMTRRTRVSEHRRRSPLKLRRRSSPTKRRSKNEEVRDAPATFEDPAPEPKRQVQEQPTVESNDDDASSHQPEVLQKRQKKKRERRRALSFSSTFSSAYSYEEDDGVLLRFGDEVIKNGLSLLQLLGGCNIVVVPTEEKVDALTQDESRVEDGEQVVEERIAETDPRTFSA